MRKATIKKSVTVILPTLNEAENIGRILSMLCGAWPNAEIIVADDGSDDGTPRIVREISVKRKNVSLLDRKDRKEHGLTASVIDAASAASGEYVVVMDADLQHPVERIGSLLAGLDDSDLSIGIRSYVKDWGLKRMAISKSVAFLAYASFAARGRPVCNDMMSGFFAVRRKTLIGIAEHNKEKFVGKGYKILVDILRLSPKGIRISETRYSAFHRRRKGRSKLGPRHVIYTLASVFS